MRQIKRAKCPRCSQFRYWANHDWCPACGYRSTGRYEDRIEESKITKITTKPRAKVMEEIKQMGFDF